MTLVMFERFRSFLIEFKYPNISSLNEDQVCDVFDSENRFFLLTWLAKLLNSYFEPPSEWTSESIDVFADFFSESGFCSPSQKHAFVTGGRDLDVEGQIGIFNRIFCFLKRSTQNEASSSSHESRDQIKELEIFLKKNVNLFPHLGPIKLISQDEKLRKKQFYEQEIAKLKEKCRDNSSSMIGVENLSCYDEEWKKSVLNSIENLSRKLQESSAGAANAANKAVEQGSFLLNSENELAHCNDEVKNILKYFETIRLSHCINEQQDEYIKPFKNDVAEIIKELVLNAVEISENIENNFNIEDY